jgi:hypothetical protein
MTPEKEDSVMICNLSRIESGQLEEIKTAERKLNKTLLAFTCHKLAADQLTDDELLVIRELERKTGTVIVAVRSE